MKITGIVVEYNPFHNGHLFQIQKARQLTQCDYLIVVMSGNFAQRGIPCITDKFTRTEMALSSGVDMVLELPVPFATASAERFCQAAISTLCKTGIVDTLCFGAEIDDLPLMEQIAHLLVEEPPTLSSLIQYHLKSGESYPRARVHAICDYLSQYTSYTSDTISTILNQPNNILGIEYIKALYKYNSTIKPLPIKRVSNGYHDVEISNTIASATAIRKAFNEEKYHLIQQTMPNQAYKLLLKHANHLPDLDYLSQSLQYKLIFSEMSDLYATWDVPKHLCHSIWHAAKEHFEISQIITAATSKTYSRATAQRSILRILMDLKASSIGPLEAMEWIPYIRVLGCRKEATILLSKLSNSATVPVITNPRKAMGQLDPLALELLKQEIRASHLYSLVSRQPIYPIHDFTKGIIIKNFNS